MPDVQVSQPLEVPSRLPGSPAIVVERLGKCFTGAAEAVWAVRDLDFTVAAGEFVALVGASGCGKTTLLRLIAGLEQPTTGHLTVLGHAVQAPRRDVGLVFQRPVLLAWRTVLDNVLLPTELARQSRQEARQQAWRWLALFGLEAFAGHRPHQLSGGMQQRVALARTLMLQPTVLLMDEPFGALDAITREQLHLELLQMWQQGQQTVVFITHDITEAVLLADRVCLMGNRPGRIVQTFTVPLPRPRSLAMRYEAHFVALCRDIHHSMGLVQGRQQAEVPYAE